MKNQASYHLSEASDYIPFRNCLAYIKEKAEVIPYNSGGNTEEKKRILAIMNDVGMKNYNKFKRRREEWDKLNGRIPLSYFDSIGVEINVLDLCIELDNEEYKKTLSFKRKCHNIVVCLMPGIYAAKRMPEEYHDEQTAIEVTHREYMEKDTQYRRAILDFPKVVWHLFERGEGYTGSTFFYPSFKIEGGHLIAVRDGQVKFIREF